MAKRSGESISPEQVENTLREHPAVFDAVVFGDTRLELVRWQIAKAISRQGDDLRRFQRDPARHHRRPHPRAPR